MRNSLVAKSEITLMQILSQIRVVTRLWKMQVTSPLSFEWISEARAYFRDRNYSVNIGLHSMKYAFEIVDMDSLIVDDITAKMFLNLSMVMRERCFGLVYGPRFSGKTATIKQLAATFGSKEYILESNCLVSNLNIIEYLKMATSGIWIVFENIHLLPREIISVFSRFL